MNSVDSKHMENLVRIFMDTFDQQRFKRIEELPCEIAVFRSNLIKEEAKEYAASEPFSVDELDAICDLLYVVIGTNLACNVGVNPIISRQLALPGRKDKYPISGHIKEMIQDLDSRFPCRKIQHATSNKIIEYLLNIGAWRGYKTRMAFDEVHRSNMTKLWDIPPCDGSYIVRKLLYNGQQRYVVKRADGKVLKPPTFQPPNLTPYLK